MPDLQTLMLFGAAVLVLLVTPGPSMVLVLSYSLSHGSRAGIAVALGILVADLIMTLLTTAGITAMVVAWTPSFDLLRYGGALYLVWLAWSALRDAQPASVEQPASRTLTRIFRISVLNSLLNPKALVFFLIFLPQFVELTSGPVATQLLVLGTLLAMLACAFHALLAIFCAAISRRIRTDARWLRHAGRVNAIVFIVLAVRVLWLDRPTIH